MKNAVWSVVAVLLLCACHSHSNRQQTADETEADSAVAVQVKYATGFSVRDSADVRLVTIGMKMRHGQKGMSAKKGTESKKGTDGKKSMSAKTDRFALVKSAETQVPAGYVKVVVPIKSTICMTSLQLSNFTVLDAHDVVKGITGTKNLFNKDIKARVKDGRIVKIGTEGEFDTELILAANPDVIFISPFKRGGYDAIKETGITLVPHLGYKELNPLGQAEWIKLVGMFIGKEREANELFAGIEQRYNDLKEKVAGLQSASSDGEASKKQHIPTVTSGEMHYGTWRAVGGKNYLAQIFRDAGADYVVKDDEEAGENMEFEKMYALSANADYWRILNSYPGEFSYEALKASEPRNELFKAFKEKQVIYCNMKQTPYYEISPVEPDVLLKDFVAIFHPEAVEKDYQPKYYHLLK